MWAKAAARLRGDTAHGVRAGVARGVGDTVHCMTLSLCMIDASDTPILSQGEPCLPPPPLRISPMGPTSHSAWLVTLTGSRPPCMLPGNASSYVSRLHGRRQSAHADRVVG